MAPRAFSFDGSKVSFLPALEETHGRSNLKRTGTRSAPLCWDDSLGHLWATSLVSTRSVFFFLGITESRVSEVEQSEKRSCAEKRRRERGSKKERLDKSCLLCVDFFVSFFLFLLNDQFSRETNEKTQEEKQKKQTGTKKPREASTTEQSCS